MPCLRILHWKSSFLTISRWSLRPRRWTAAGSAASLELLIDSLIAADEGANLLVAEDAADTASARLLDADALSALVVEREVEQPHGRAVGPPAGGDDGYRLQIRGARRLALRGEDSGEHFGEEMSVRGNIGRRLVELDETIVAVDENDGLALRLALKLEGVPAGELEVGAKMAADIGVDGHARHGRKRSTRLLPEPG